MLPAFLLMLVITPLYLKYGRVLQVEGFFWWVRPAVVAVILAAAWRLGKKFVVDWGAAAIAVLVCAGALASQFTVLKLNPILLILIAGILGMVFRGRAGEEAAK